MRSSQLFWRMFLAYAGLVLLGIIASTASIASWEEDQLIEQANRRLRDAGILLRENVASRLPSKPSEQLQNEIRELSKQLEMRFTIIADDGKVLADSAQESLAAVAKMENHRSRTEFVKALRAGEGTTRRNSPTLGDAYYYYAIAIERDGKNAGIVRTALSASFIQQQLDAMQRLVWSIGGVLGLLGLLTTYWLTTRLVSPITVLTDAAEGIAAGKYSQRIRVNSQDEFGMLARSFERMSNELG